MSLSSLLYRAARLSRDVAAARRGPDVLAKRLVRKAVYRKVNGATAKALNQLLK